MTERHNVLVRVLDWLKAGYPSGFPSEDRVALLGILHRHLTEDEVLEIAHTLRSLHGSPYTDEEIAEQIRLAAAEQPSEEDIHRVSERLASAGWTLNNG